MTKNTPKPRIVVELDPEHMRALDRARRNVGLMLDASIRLASPRWRTTWLWNATGHA